MSNKDLENYDTKEYHKNKVSNKYEELLYEAENLKIQWKYIKKL